MKAIKNVLVIGANGKVGRLIIPRLVSAGKHVRAMIRSKEQADLMISLGVQPHIADLEKDFTTAFDGMDCVIFTAGSGSKTGPEKTIDVDQNAAIRSIDLAKQVGISLYVMVSAQGARDPDSPSPIQHYFRAKAIADNYLVNSGVDHIIFRPGRLLDEQGTGRVRLGRVLDRGGVTHRDDLAEVIVRSLDERRVHSRIIEILSGDDPIESALAKLSGAITK